MGLTLVLVRHGETDWSAEKRYCGRTDVPLNEAGRAQAAALTTLGGETFDAIWTSPLRRCVETAASIGVDAAPVDALQEFDFGAVEGKRWHDLDEATQSALIDFEGFEAPGGETVVEFGRRIDAFLAGLDDGRHLLVTHGGVIRHLLRRAAEERPVAPGSWVEVGFSSPRGTD